jgi:hypothetical protein
MHAPNQQILPLLYPQTETRWQEVKMKLDTHVMIILTFLGDGLVVRSVATVEGENCSDGGEECRHIWG